MNNTTVASSFTLYITKLCGNLARTTKGLLAEYPDGNVDLHNEKRNASKLSNFH